jgi:hypothetical protein
MERAVNNTPRQIATQCGKEHLANRFPPRVGFIDGQGEGHHHDESARDFCYSIDGFKQPFAGDNQIIDHESFPGSSLCDVNHSGSLRRFYCDAFGAGDYVGSRRGYAPAADRNRQKTRIPDLVATLIPMTNEC